MGEKWPVKYSQTIRLPLIAGFFNIPQSCDMDRRFYFPSEGRHAKDFFARKIRRLRPGLNLRTWVPEASMLTTRPLAAENNLTWDYKTYHKACRPP
jgi:hypothetical protein